MIRVGTYVVRVAQTGEDVAAAQHMRYRAFNMGTDPAGMDDDRFDPAFSHLLVQDGAGQVAATLRFKVHESAQSVVQGYSGGFYDLSALSNALPALEVGRFCLDPEAGDAASLRLAMGAMTQIVLQKRAAVMFGCSSFAGTDPSAHAGALSALAPSARAVSPRSPYDDAAFALSSAQSAGVPQAIPPLLRGYLAMGGWVSDHAVIDRGMGTLHVLTAVEVAKIPPARRRVLEQLAAALPGRITATP